VVKTIDIEKIVRSVVKELMTSMNHQQHPPKQKSHLLWIVDDLLTLENYQEQLLILKQKEIAYDVLLIGDQEEQSLTTKTDHLLNGQIYTLTNDKTWDQFYNKSFKTYVIPEIDLDDSSRIVNGIKSSPLAHIFITLLMQEKEIVTSSQLTGIKQADKQTLQITQLPSYYNRLFKNNLKTLANMGVKFIKPHLIAETLGNVSKTAKSTPKVTEGSANEMTFTHKLLTAEWVESQDYLADQTLHVKKRTIISPLALDVMKEKNVTISYID